MKIRKCLSFLLEIIMGISMTTSVLATSSSAQMQPYASDLLIYESSHGVFKAADDRDTAETIRLLPDTQFEGIYTTTSQDQYYQKINDEEFIPVQKVEFALTSYAAYTDIQKYSLPDEVLEGIASMAALAEETNSEDARAIIFVEDKSLNNGNLNTCPPTTTTWDGYTFHHYEIYFTDMWTKWQDIATGSETTETVLSSITSLIMIAASEIKEEIGSIVTIYDIFSNCLDAWLAITEDTPIYGNTDNAVMVDIGYDIYLKYTYYYDQFLKVDRLGCCSQKAIINCIKTTTYLYSSTGGDRAETASYPYEVFKTPNYNYPEATAYDYQLNSWYERVEGTIYDKTIEFSWPSFSWPSDWP